MLFHEPPPTAFDLRFRLFWTRVRISPGFWVMNLLLGWGYAQQPAFSENGVPELALWILAVSLSILLHEFGHIWMGRWFGNRGEIVLHTMGGLAIGSNSGLERWRSIAVSLAGPAIQLALWGLLLLAWQYEKDIRSYKALVLLLRMLTHINLYWALFNLLPLWPLDGGQVTRTLAVMVSNKHGVAVSLWISLLLSVALIVNALMPTLLNRPSFLPYGGDGKENSFFFVVFFAQFAVGAYLELSQRRSRRVFDDPW